MTDATRRVDLDADLVLAGDEVIADLRDRRADSFDLFHSLDAYQRNQLAVDAWSIGLRALQNAHRTANEAKLQDVGNHLLTAIEQQLRAHVELQQTTMRAVLSRYFDPSDGQVAQRLATFVDDDGALARMLERFLAPNNSVLADTLARHVGENSPVLRKLSSSESDGVIQTIEDQLRSLVDHSHAELTRALDPLIEGSAVARFLASLRQELIKADDDREGQLSAALAALNANDESSLLSRLVRETERARHEVLASMNPDVADSPIALLKGSLTALLSEHAERQADSARRQELRQSEFEREVRDALARIETRRAADLRAARGGFDFEDAVLSFIHAATQGAPCILDASGRSAGIGRCKKGDAVLRFTAESAFDGATVVFEAKRDSSYTIQRALDELDAARRNRDASVGVFVMAKSHASEVFPRFARYGHNVLVTWDDTNAASDPYLHAAVLLGMSLATRTRTAGDVGDIAALRDIEARIDSELSRLGKMEKFSESIRKSVEGISDEIRKARNALDILLRKAGSTLRALNIEVFDEHSECATPIALAGGSLDAARRAIPNAIQAVNGEVAL